MGTVETNAYATYEWDCGECGGTHSVDHDPTGETIECPECGVRNHIQMTL